MPTELMPNQASFLEKVVIEGDLSVLTPEERMFYYKSVCQSVGLNPLTKPFEYIKLNNKLTLYAKRDATDQLRSLRGISVQIIARETVGDVYVVTARATDNTGRTDESIGAVPLKGLSGETLANAFMKAETKAKRRVTLSISGLGLLDETEVMTVPGAQIVSPDSISPPPASSERREPPRKSEGAGTISEPQQKRLFAMAKEHKVSLDDVKTFLGENFQIHSTKEIKREHYDDIIRWIELGGYLRTEESDTYPEPGSEG